MYVCYKIRGRGKEEKFFVLEVICNIKPGVTVEAKKVENGRQLIGLIFV